jgi:DNA-binding NtrC family response regulator
MSIRYPSEQLADLRHGGGTAERQTAMVRPAAVDEDEDVAGRSAARLLITASTQRGVETLARRIHGAGRRAQFPFVRTWAGDLPVAPQALREYCCGVLDAAAGGSMLIAAVEEMPPPVQDALIDLLAGLEVTRGPAAAVRLISGTTVSLLDRVAAGTFSERLFYQLNVIHLMAADDPSEVART